MFISRTMRSVFELGDGDLVSKLETNNSATLLELKGGLNREVQEKFFLGVYLSPPSSINREFPLYLGFKG